MTEAARPQLRKGSRIAVVSPAAAAHPGKIEAGMEALRAHGYVPVAMPHAFHRGPLYYAGPAEQRAADLHAAFADPEIEGILCTRGGWGSAELLPMLQSDLVRAHPKVFVGYSDHTSLHTWMLQCCGLATFYAPMVAADWSLPGGVELRSWDGLVEGQAEYWFGSHDGLEVLREGEAQGTLQGGCLAILEASLGTPWAFRPEGPCILFLEDIGVKPFQWDRMLQHLRFAGAMDQVRGVVLGDMSANVSLEELPLLKAACLHALRDFSGPIALGLRCGHVTGGNRTVVLGAEAKLRCAQGAELTIAGPHNGVDAREELWRSTSI